MGALSWSVWLLLVLRELFLTHVFENLARSSVSKVLGPSVGRLLIQASTEDCREPFGLLDVGQVSTVGD